MSSLCMSPRRPSHSLTELLVRPGIWRREWSVSGKLCVGVQDRDRAWRSLVCSWYLIYVTVARMHTVFISAASIINILTYIHREACRIANCLDFIEQWDQGFDTVRLCNV
jgi:hypothetical protein